MSIRTVNSAFVLLLVVGATVNARHGMMVVEVVPNASPSSSPAPQCRG
jgi:hypothetical protein